MITKAIKVASISALSLLLLLLWRAGNETPALFASFVVWAGAMVVLISALSDRKYLWGAAFAAIAITFNPAAPALFSPQTSAALYLGCIAMFAYSLRYLQTRPQLSVASVTDPAPRGEAL
jgi:hypothetical protein